ncbi:MAG: hypothetical protein LBE81_03740 [Azonexus sp.]|uniref:hypothetical protein n=1 Tax=Azonexus sp. TaxID=1872668 RepID=UPI0028282256|nr:hypothetical protein [Azonexus sp.]MDR0775735.1 hypothetical protein [Azonexus sp.]
MKFRVFLLLLLVALFGAAAPAVARNDGGYGAMRGPGWGDRRELAPDERREMRRQMREHWRQEHSPRADGKPRWRSMDPDERRRLRDEMREHRGRPDGYRGERMQQTAPPM